MSSQLCASATHSSKGCCGGGTSDFGCSFGASLALALLRCPAMLLCCRGRLACREGRGAGCEKAGRHPAPGCRRFQLTGFGGGGRHLASLGALLLLGPSFAPRVHHYGGLAGLNGPTWGANERFSERKVAECNQHGWECGIWSEQEQKTSRTEQGLLEQSPALPRPRGWRQHKRT